MKITVRKFTAKDTKCWDDFVNQSNNGTIFHLRSFLSYHIDRKFIDHSLVFEKKGRIIALFPAAEINNNGIKILQSHPGASFGGFVFNFLSFEDANLLITDTHANINGYDIVRTYDYLYTGKNDDILDFRIKYNALFYQAAQMYSNQAKAENKDAPESRRK